MRGFGYFISGAHTKPRPADVALDYAFERNSAEAWNMVTKGPNGKPGGIIAAHSDLVGYYPDRQEWRKATKRRSDEATKGQGSDEATKRRSDGGELDIWFGWDFSDPPGPEDLARANIVAGEVIELRDGNRWVVPIAREVIEFQGGLLPRPGLPCLIGRDDEGNWIRGEVVPEHRALWEGANRYFDALLAAIERAAEGDSEAATDCNYMDVAALALAGNYRVGPDEIVALELLDESLGQQVCNITVRWNAWVEWGKKNAAVASGGST